MHSASNEMKSLLVMMLPSYPGKHFESIDISKQCMMLNVLLNCGEIFKPKYLIKEQSKNGIKTLWPNSLPDNNYTLFCIRKPSICLSFNFLNLSRS